MGQVKAYRRGWVAEAPQGKLAAATADSSRLVCGFDMVKFAKQPDGSWCIAMPASDEVKSFADVTLDKGAEGLRVTFPGRTPQLLSWPSGTGPAEIDACSARFSKRRGELLITLPAGSAQVEQEPSDTHEADPDHRLLESNSSFEAADTFAGARPGMVFKKGALGVGYYKDEATASCSSSSSARCAEELACRKEASVPDSRKEAIASSELTAGKENYPDTKRASQEKAEAASKTAIFDPNAYDPAKILHMVEFDENGGAKTVLGAIKDAAKQLHLSEPGNLLEQEAEEAAAEEEVDEQALALQMAGILMLHSAASIGDAAKAEQLLSAGVDANGADETGVCPLEKACTGIHMEVVAALLKHGARINGVSSSSSTPLHRAVSAGSRARELVQLLCASGASCTARDRAGRTAATLAQDMGLDLPGLK